MNLKKLSKNKGKKQAEENFAKDYIDQVFPYERNYKVKSDALLAFKEIEKVEVGYQYQLFVKGCPSLSPAIVVLETYKLKQFKLNENAIYNLVNSALASNTELIGVFLKVVKNLIENNNSLWTQKFY